MPQIINNWPYSDMHNLNLDWILTKIKKLGHEVENMEEFFPHISTWNNGNWDIDHDYELNEIVINGNDIYMAKKNVPAGENINNTDYWLLVGTDSYITNKVDKTGDAMTGDLVFIDHNPEVRLSSIDINSTPAGLVSHDIISAYDTNHTEISMMRARQNTAGDVGVEFDARRQVGGNTIFNGVSFMIASDGTRSMAVSETGQWKDALALTWTPAVDWVTAVGAAKMDIMIDYTFTVNTTNISLQIMVPVCLINSAPTFHYSQTAQGAGELYYAQARLWDIGMDYTAVYDKDGTVVTGVTTSFYYR